MLRPKQSVEWTNEYGMELIKLDQMGLIKL